MPENASWFESFLTERLDPPKKKSWFESFLTERLPEAADGTFVAGSRPTLPANQNTIGPAAPKVSEGLRQAILAGDKRRQVRAAVEGGQMLPGVLSDLSSGATALLDLAEGDYSGAALNSIGVLPFVAGMGRMQKAGGTDRLLKALSKKGGATLTPDGKPFTGSAYMVADPAFTLKTASPDEMRAFVERPDVKKALEEGKLFGTWTDPETKITEVNLSDPIVQKAEALALARKRGEKAIGEIQAGAYAGDIPATQHVGGAALRIHVPGESTPKIYSGGPHLTLYAKAEDELGDLDNLKVDHGFLGDDGETWFDQAAGFLAARKAGQLTKDPKILERMMKSGNLYSEGLVAPGAGASEATVKAAEPWANANQPITWDQKPWTPPPLPTDADRIARIKESLKTANGEYADQLKADLTRLEQSQIKQADFARNREDPIVAAAIRTPDGRYFEGVNHGDAFNALADVDAPLAREMERGPSTFDLFKTKSGKYVTRQELAGELGRRPVAELMNLDAPPKPAPAPKTGLLGSWQPTSHGIFNRDGAATQGTAPVDPRLFPETKVEPSELTQAIANSKRVERGLRGDIEKGLPLGGDRWYEGAPVRQSFEEMDGPFGFHDFNIARGSGSIQSPTHLEIPTATALLYGRRQGLNSLAEIKAAQQAMHPGEPNLWGTEGAFANYRRAVENDAHLPPTPGSGDLKLPGYFQGMEGGVAGKSGIAALDKHERRRMMQLAWSDPKIRTLLKELGFTEATATGTRAEMVPITNRADYLQLNRPYQRLAKKMGLPAVQTGQAGRWLGGAELTGLKSEPKGDFTQTLENVVKHTALMRGLPTSPPALRALWARLAQGEDIATPVYGNNPLGYLTGNQGSLFD